MGRTLVVFGWRLVVEAALSLWRRGSIRTARERVIQADRWGLTWSLDLRDNLQRRLYFSHSYEAATLFQVARRMRPDDDILDVGANIGTFVLPLLRHAATRGTAVAVEPAPDTVEKLRGHVHVNHMSNRVTVVPAALADSNSRKMLFASKHAMDSGLRSLQRGGPPIGTIDVRRGDDLVREVGPRRIDVLKIDVEGGERAVLAGLEGELRLRPPRIVVVELAGRDGHPAGVVAATVEMLRGLGYHGWWIRYRGLEDMSHSRRTQGNALFVRADQPPRSPDRRRTVSSD